MRYCSTEAAPGTWLASTWACLAEVPQRFGTNTELRPYHLTCGANGPVFVEVVEDHPDGSLTLLGWVTLGHDLHPPQKGSGIKPATIQTASPSRPQGASVARPLP